MFLYSNGNILKTFPRFQLHISEAPILIVTDLSELCLNTTINNHWGLGYLPLCRRLRPPRRGPLTLRNHGSTEHCSWTIITLGEIRFHVLPHPRHASNCIVSLNGWWPVLLQMLIYSLLRFIFPSLRLILGLFNDSFNGRSYRPTASNYMGRVCISSCYVKT